MSLGPDEFLARAHGSHDTPQQWEFSQMFGEDDETSQDESTYCVLLVNLLRLCYYSFVLPRFLLPRSRVVVIRRRFNLLRARSPTEHSPLRPTRSQSLFEANNLQQTLLTRT